MEKPGNLDKPVFKQEFSESVLESLGTFQDKARKVLIAGSALFITGLVAQQVTEKHKKEAFMAAYQAYAAESMTPEEKQKYETLADKIRTEFGPELLSPINSADGVSFENQGIIHEPPTIEGLENIDDPEVRARIEYLITVNLDPEFGIYPESWITNEIDRFVIEDSTQEPEPGVSTIFGKIGNSVYQDRETVVLFNFDSTDHPDALTSQQTSGFSHVLAHEIAHANDWESRGDLNLLERVELLQKVLERMESDDPYTDELLAGDSYWQSRNDGSAQGLRSAAKEYWAIICENYIHQPEKLQAESPKDFALVNAYVQQTDEAFDVLHPDRKIYDGQTGEVNPKWAEKVAEIKARIGID